MFDFEGQGGCQRILFLTIKSDPYFCLSIKGKLFIEAIPKNISNRPMIEINVKPDIKLKRY